MTDRLKVQNRFLIPSTYVNSNTPGMALAPLAARAGHLNAKGAGFRLARAKTHTCTAPTLAEKRSSCFQKPINRPSVISSPGKAGTVCSMPCTS